MSTSNDTPDLFEQMAEPTTSEIKDMSVESSGGKPPAIPIDLTAGDGDTLPLAAYAERAYLAYAMSVVRARALPQVEDGLKPVQRRILFAMNQMRLSATSKHVKSARVVGDVIGKYHPHGDTSIYDAMVRVAQDFSLRYPLVDGQGNFGSRDGDGAAAMRYTECRLTPFAELLLGEIDRGTIDFLPNYDGSMSEPQLLPARLPVVLLNGASGIAVGMATEIPPHNLREVSEALRLLIKKPGATLDEVLGVLPGPDFPGGGQLITPKREIHEMYANGRGSLRMRARWRIEELARGQWRVIVYELPHGVSVAQVLSEIEGLTNPQPRMGKKDVSQEQKNLKTLVLSVLDSVRDESSDQQAVRIMLEPKSSRLNTEEFMAVLLAHTSLESSVSINLTMVGRLAETSTGGGRPQQKGLLQILREWIAFRFATVERRTQHRLSEVSRRIHILEGRMLVFLRIDDVIRCIRESDEPKPALIDEFGLTELQAEDILEIRLRQLARLEGIRIERELGELRDEHSQLLVLLDDRKELTKLILKEIADDTKRFGDDRRTLMEAVAPVTSGEIAVPDEPVTIIVSKNGWVRARQGHSLDLTSISYKAGDFAFAVMESRTVWPLVVIDSNGRAYSIRVSDLPGGRGDGLPITTLVDFQDDGKMAQVLSAPLETQFLVAGSGGCGFIASISDMVGRNKAGKGFISLDRGERPVLPSPVGAGDTPSARVAVITKSGRLLIFPLRELKVMSKGKGLMLIDLTKTDEVAGLVVAGNEKLLIGGIGRGGKLVEQSLSLREQTTFTSGRARKGHEIPFKLKPLRIGVESGQ